jgi:hypothetical protein
MLDDSGLTRIISDVRKRWRFKLVLRGVVRSVAVAIALFFAAAYGLEWARFSPVSILAARVLLALAILGSFYYFLIRPLRRQVTDEQVALYLEECEPSLQATLVSAVEASRVGGDSTSRALVRRLVEQAIEACATTGAVRRVEQIPLRRWGAVLAAVSAVSILMILFGPAFLRSALSAILLVQRGVEAAAPYRIEVDPGNATIPKGVDQTITATLQGFSAEDAELMVRRTADGAFEPMPLVRAEDGGYEGILFDVAGSLAYYVAAEGVRSPTFALTVVDVPYVQRLQLEYHFPAYTGLDPQTIEDGGDIAVLAGTEVRLKVFPTMKSPGGRVALNEKGTAELVPQADGTLTGTFKVAADGFYRVELQSPTGELAAASPQYTIDVLTDQPPTISFSKPGRDTSASAIEEVYVEAQAEDDFGVRNLELVYSVNGGPEKTVPLFAGRNRLPEVTAGHTFFMEELGVQQGDSVSYYARARDNSASGQPATSDLYFLRVRPFSRDFRQAASMAGGGGGGGGAGDQVEALSEQQRQIISATFNVQRDRRKTTPAKLRESTTVVGLSQSRLREQVEGLVTRLNSQLIERDPAFEKIGKLLPQAIEAMKEAEGKLAAVSPDGALPPEHKALQILQQAEEEYEYQVSMQQGGGGGGGGGGGAQQQELADIFEQELEKMASRYETAAQAQQQSGDRELDELLEKLKELARRQEQEAARQKLRALEMGGSSSGGAAQQRALAEQAEEAARRLERLAREENRQDLMEAARQMQQAADAMRRAAAGGDANASGQAASALERLRETERRLQQNQADRAERDIDEAIRQAEDIARRQREIGNEARQLAATPNSTARREEARQINDRKSDLESRLNALEQQLDRAARDASANERAASRKMAEAAGSIRDNRLGDKLRYSQNLVNRGSTPQAVDAAENDIASGIDEVRDRLGEAQAALGQGEDENAGRMETALERARRLARAAESLQERTRERAQQGRQGQQGQAGQQGQQGQAGQQGQQGQSGQQGQQGEQGQSGQQGQQAGNQGSQGSQGSEGSGGSQGSQGSDGSQGGGQQAGGRGDVNNGGVGGGAYGGANWGGGYGYEWYGGRLTEEDIRQLRGEARQWINEGAELRRDLQAENIDPRDLDNILRDLRRLDDPRVYQDVAELARLQSQIAEGMKRFEFGLRRQADANANAIVLTGSDEVPEDFRKLVQEYFRSLARTPR